MAGEMTIAHLRTRLTYWQHVLNLPEWTLSVRWGTLLEMDETVGQCYWSSEELCAQILMARKQEDYESTLVHELLHILLEGHETMSGEYSEMHERAINRLAAALCGLNRH